MNEKASASAADARDARLNRYRTLGLGAAVLAGAVTTMDASVAYTNYNGQVLSDTNTADASGVSYDFDFNNDGTNDIRFTTRNTTGGGTGSNYALIFGGVTNNSVLHPLNVAGGTASGANGAVYVYPSRLGAGVTVGPALTFVTLALTAASSYLQAGTLAFGNGFTGSKFKTAGANAGFLGVSFTLADGLHYGFADISVAPQSAGALARSITLNALAYETTPGTAIATFGAPVPEPSAIALVALGGLGLAAYRRRARSNAAAVAA